jgi:phosphoenolpyruvate-protein kinase (PTS system EI component)
MSAVRIAAAKQAVRSTGTAAARALAQQALAAESAAAVRALLAAPPSER